MMNLILISILCGKIGFEGNLFSQSVFSVGSQKLVQPDVYKPPNTFVYIVEGIGATVGGIGGVYGGAVGMWYLSAYATGGINIDKQVPYMYGGMLGGFILGTACGTVIAGKIMKQKGSFKNSVIGATVGILIGGGLAVLYRNIVGNPHPVIVIGAISLPITGAVIGYNWRKK